MASSDRPRGLQKGFRSECQLPLGTGTQVQPESALSFDCFGGLWVPIPEKSQPTKKGGRLFSSGPLGSSGYPNLVPRDLKGYLLAGVEPDWWFGRKEPLDLEGSHQSKLPMRGKLRVGESRESQVTKMDTLLPPLLTSRASM